MLHADQLSAPDRLIALRKRRCTSPAFPILVKEDSLAMADAPVASAPIKVGISIFLRAMGGFPRENARALKTNNTFSTCCCSPACHPWQRQSNWMIVGKRA